MALAITLVICATVLWIFERSFEKLKWLRGTTDVLTVSAPQEAQAAAPVEAEPIPPDLLELALGESEQWAKEQALGAMIDMRQRVGNWNIVRAIWRGDEKPDMVS